MSDFPRIVDEEFAKRLAQACENNSHAPSGHGRQRWLMREVTKLSGTVVSPEAVRRWFAGESRPRPKTMSAVAEVLQVDEAWLSLGIMPTATPREKKKLNAMASGAVNLVAAQIQLAGGNIAFPDAENADHDIMVIIRGKSYALTVKFAEGSESFKLSLFSKAHNVIIVVPTKHPTVFDFVRVPSNILDIHSLQRGGYSEIDITRDGKQFKVGDEILPVITTFENIEGTAPMSLKARALEVREKVTASVQSKLPVEKITETRKPH